MLGDVNKNFIFKSLLTMPRNVLPLRLMQTFPELFTEVEDDEIESRLPFKIFSTLLIKTNYFSLHFRSSSLVK